MATGSGTSLIVELIRLCVWLVVLVAIFAPLEQVFAVHEHRFLRRQFVTDLGHYFVNNLLWAVAIGVPIGLLLWAVHRVMPAALLGKMAGLPVWVRVAVAFIAGETGYYWGHRLSHEVPVLWRFHSIHHSAEEMDFLVNTRAHPVDLVWGRFCMLVPIYLLGLGGPAIMGGTAVPVAVILIGTLWSFFVHANLRWRFGPLEWLVATPLFHHWHHTRSGPIDKNYASNLPLLDWVFGSLHLPEQWPENYGIKASMPAGLVDQLFHPFLPAESRPPAKKQPAATPATPSLMVDSSTDVTTTRRDEPDQ